MDGCFQAYLLNRFLIKHLLTSWVLNALIYNLGCFPFDISPLRDYVCIDKFTGAYYKFLQIKLNIQLLYFKITLPRTPNLIRITTIIFAENQLSLILIGLSPLPTSHLRILQHSRVRSSRFSPLNLLISRSTSFGSNKNNFILPFSLRLLTN